MSLGTDLLAIAGLGVGGIVAWKYRNEILSWLTSSNQGSRTSSSVASASIPTTSSTPFTAWSWFVPGTGSDLLTQWQANAAAANVGSITTPWGGWNIAQDVSFLGQWWDSITSATGLRW